MGGGEPDSNPSLQNCTPHIHLRVLPSVRCTSHCESLPFFFLHLMSYLFMDPQRLLIAFSLVLFCTGVVAGGTGNVGLAEKCGDEFQKVVVCLEYATGREATPSKECCSSVKSIKDSNPECLCFLIQQTGNGSDKLKSMGVQEAKLLQLPSSCDLKNASISDCPKLLGISPSSPDAAIFMKNGSSEASPSTAAAATTESPNSYAARLEPSLGSLTMTAIAILFVVLPLGSLLLPPFSHT